MKCWNCGAPQENDSYNQMKVDMMMHEQFGSTSPAHGPGLSGPRRPLSSRPTELSPAETPRTPGPTVNDAERLDDLRTKLRRISGNKDWTVKREEYACELIREIAAIEGFDWGAVIAKDQ